MSKQEGRCTTQHTVSKPGFSATRCHVGQIQRCRAQLQLRSAWLRLYCRTLPLEMQLCVADKAVETTVDTAVLVVERLLPDCVAAVQPLPVNLLNASVLNGHVDALAASLGLTAVA